MHIPASSRVGCVGVDNHEALVRVRKVGVVGASEVGLGGTSAVVHGDDEGGVRHETSGLVLVHLDVGGVAAEVGNLNQLVLSSESAHGADGEGDEGEHAGEHLVLSGLERFAFEHGFLYDLGDSTLRKKRRLPPLSRGIPLLRSILRGSCGNLQSISLSTGSSTRFSSEINHMTDRQELLIAHIDTCKHGLTTLFIDSRVYGEAHLYETI